MSAGSAGFRVGPRRLYPRVAAHRGGGVLAPENTLAAIRFGAQSGFRGVEFDVMLAGDGTPVLIHDETLDRTTGVRGEVARTPWARLAQLDAGAWRGARWRGERIPSFDQAAVLCRSLGLWANVEIKPARGMDAETGTAVARFAREAWRGVHPVPVLSSFSVAALAAARAAAPGLPRGLLCERFPRNWRQRLRSTGSVALHCNWRELTAGRVAALRRAGYAVLAWTVNSRAVARRLLAWGVDCLVTDRLDRITPGLARSAAPAARTGFAPARRPRRAFG